MDIKLMVHESYAGGHHRPRGQAALAVQVANRDLTCKSCLAISVLSPKEREGFVDLVR